MNIFLLCVKIFFARIIDVTLGTIRTIITVKDKILVASIIGFFETLIWFLIVNEALSSEKNIFIGIFYALGFASGTFIGGVLSKYIIKGNLTVQIISSKVTSKWLSDIRDNGFAISIMDIEQNSDDEDKYLLFLEINSRDFKKLYRLTKKYDDKAFIVVNESIKVINGYFNQK